VTVVAGTRWSLLLLLGTLTMIDIMSIDLYLPAFPAIARTFGASASEVQATLSVFVFGMAGGQLVYGPIFDRFGRRAPLLFGIALFVAGTVLAALAPTIGLLLLARLLQAGGAAAGIVAPRAVVTDLFAEQDAAAVYSVLGQIQMLAPIIAPVLGAAILLWSGWRASFWVLALIGVAIWVIAYRVAPDSLPPERRSPLSLRSVASAYAGLLRNRPFIFYSAANTLLFGALFAYLSVSPFVLIAHFGFSTMQFGLIFGGIALAAAAMGALNIRLLPVFGLRAVLLCGLGVSCLAGLALCALSVLHGSGWAYVAALTCFVGAFGLIIGNLIASTMARAGAQAGVGSAFMGAGQYVGGAVVGLVTGWIGTTPGVLGAALLTCGLATLAFVAAAERSSRYPIASS
jgi:DHA1 family bicyclomycin/chloramphenicol resistance-like MFS transporter